jgi:integrase
MSVPVTPAIAQGDPGSPTKNATPIPASTPGQVDITGYATASEKTQAGLSAQTIHHVHACLHKACKDAVRWGQLARNPLDAADPPRATADGSREMKTWTAEQLQAFLSAVSAERLSPLWHTIAMTGMRRGEALGLRWSDVDLEAGRLAVRRALIPDGRDVIVSEPKTAKPGFRSCSPQ